jgi:hypothetical protein
MLSRYIHSLTIALSMAIVFAIICSVAFYDELKPFADKFGNLAGVLGLCVSVAGFPLTVWAVLEAIRVSAAARKEIRKEIASVRQETKVLLGRIRLKSVSDVCDQAFNYATESRSAIRSNSWHRAAERCHDARLLTLDLLAYDELKASESTIFRAVVEDLKTVISFIERNRLKPQSIPGMPSDKIAPLDLLIDGLQTVRSRLKQELLEYSNDN